MVYLAKKDDGVVHHTSLEALKEMDGIEKPDMEISNEEFEAAGCLARIIKGKIFIGKTDEEKTAEENEQMVIELKRKLAETDYVVVKIAEGAATKADYADAISKRQAWRKQIGTLEKR
jgi:chromatin segregation and condensation protein Rec8/ScpA/Scc1 (kleisin family)